MTDLTQKQLQRIGEFHRQHGEAWSFIHRAGYVGEVWPGGLYASEREAWKAAREAYDDDEWEDARVDVAHWDVDGEFWSYDH